MVRLSMRNQGYYNIGDRVRPTGSFIALSQDTGLDQDLIVDQGNQGTLVCVWEPRFIDYPWAGALVKWDAGNYRTRKEQTDASGNDSALRDDGTLTVDAFSMLVPGSPSFLIFLPPTHETRISKDEIRAEIKKFNRRAKAHERRLKGAISKAG